MESISRISGLLETARDLTLEAARDAGPRRPNTGGRAMPAATIKKLLDSRNEREVLDGLRRVIAMQYASPPLPTLPFFPAVLKTLSNPFPSTRPLVYNYLLHHAEADPDTTLLSINTIQKSLSDTNPRVRAMALKTMAGIRVPMVSQLVSLAIKKGVSDLSPLVRKAASLACVKCVRLDEGTRGQVEEYLGKLLGDAQYFVVGGAVQAFAVVCPERWDMLHPVYRRVCRMLGDMDEWGQLALLRVMVGYARSCFPRRTKRVRKSAATREEKARDFYEDLDAEKDEEDEAAFEDVEVLDPDLELLLTSAQPLLQSRSSAVIVAVARLYLYLAPTTHLPHAIGPLIALLRSPNDIQQLALANIAHVCAVNPHLFAPYLRHFLLRSADSPQTRSRKLDILCALFPHCPPSSQALVLAELEHFASSHHDPDLVRASVRALGSCAQVSDPRTSRRCLALLLRQLHSSDAVLVGEAMDVVRRLVQREPAAHARTVVRLAKHLDGLTSPAARASIVWLVGEFGTGEQGEGEGEGEGDGGGGIAADVLRILLRGYADESDEVRAQILLLASKVYLHHLNARNAKRRALEALDPASPDKEGDQDKQQESQVLSPPAEEGGFREDAFAPDPSRPHDPDGAANGSDAEDSDPIPLLYAHTQLLARYTPSYDLRDRARALRSLLAVPSSTDMASLLLLAPKPVPVENSGLPKQGVLGGVGVAVGGSEEVKGWELDIPGWVEEGKEPDARVRDDGVGAGRGAGGGAGVSAGDRLEEALGDADEVRGKAVGGGGVGKAGRGEKSLDDWLDEETGSESGETGTETEDSGGSGEYETDSEEEESGSESEEDERSGLVR